MTPKKGNPEDVNNELPEDIAAAEVSGDLPDLESEAIGFTEIDAASVASTIEKGDDLKGLLDKAAKDYLYLRAEYDNYRRQAIKERADLVRYSGEKLARDLLETLDIFDTALAADVNAENYQNFAKGIQLTAQQLRATLNKHGIHDVPSQGEVFNPLVHEALASAPSDDVPAGHIVQVFKKPYKYHDKVLRPGQVVVAKPKES